MAQKDESNTSSQPTRGPGGGHGPGGPRGVVEKPKNFWKTTARLMHYMSDRIVGLILVLIFAITSVIFQIRTPKILGQATTEIYKGVMKGSAQQRAGFNIGNLPINFDKIVHIIIIVALMYLASAIFSYLQQFIMTLISQKTVYRLRKQMKQKMRLVPIKYYDTHSNGDIMSRAVNDMDNIASTLQQSLTQAVTSLVTFIGTLWMMFSISWKLTLIAFVTIPLSIVVVGIVAPKSQKYFAAQQKSLGLLNNQVEENYAGQLVLKSFNKEKDTIDKFEEQNDKYYQSAWKAQFISGIIMPLMIFMNNIGYVFVAIIGGIQVANGSITLGNVQAFLQYTNQFSQPISQLANLMNTIQSTIASAERVFDVIDEEEMKNTHQNRPVEKGTDNIVSLEHVQFGYEESDLLLTDYNLQVKQGQQVAIVGPTGAGKTTIINLLERFYDVSGGSIRLKGVDTRDIDREKLRSHFAMVLQDTWLFTGTIYDNIKYGREDATHDDIIEAAKAAHVDEFVRKLPDGYDTVLNEAASNISQGQRQLVTIARAFVANPEILILDEATSSVDTRTEVQIQHAMSELLKNRTSFVVAHRLSTIQNADNIIVMNHGSVVETGTHNELLAKNGFYADLYNSQFSDNVSFN
ncbi:ABC transporter ATP-binding protein [Lentilactobacillus hilgardii]|uniref:ABC transporter, ATP-binding protein n=1 Tax=Lentilactobacillus hilgardii (strain ATCC 8290 / DSM 20176 / CCUG 30140 / JCM 1155 / KCTC 3500 / NBRC 15886 / NCIMB 8040 / NRRL B-1843 / 9) TaxID=1423757 RepID=C0XK07_LENH9|nr:ABC transporter ATP-binding protein [Lentilactobacillus hilgardii]EEI24294.1 ABC transporter, ATP-binding protein [Lentilactobacillus hilgardii DSM 20176 = ATCC 8290]KRK58874.1 xenobiotic-transporting ATPase [Lentilactobacillus hilgardii DSM 20176 = ATCC 8290]MCP9332798.1 ABC transporter ATP-binding protein [Lentilactobacillus hilgardii]MCP9349453.1 ABC transporter ATP-binding protein [Lentilactobacillus hilgardii]MCP9352275.1 ABC transporter ATP-binding protein [Lentilactobacillus hilgardi